MLAEAATTYVYRDLHRDGVCPFSTGRRRPPILQLRALLVLYVRVASPFPPLLWLRHRPKSLPCRRSPFPRQQWTGLPQRPPLQKRGLPALLRRASSQRFHHHRLLPHRDPSGAAATAAVTAATYASGDQCCRERSGAGSSTEYATGRAARLRMLTSTARLQAPPWRGSRRNTCVTRRDHSTPR